MKYFLRGFWMFFLCIYAVAQGNLKLMTYNLFRFPSANPSNRELILRDILATYQPDIFMVCELETQAGADLILNESLLPLNSHYAMATFHTNSSSSTDFIQQLVFYNSQKLTLINEQVHPTILRDLNHYTFKLNTLEASAETIFLDVFVNHLKSSTGTSNQQDRLTMVNTFVDALSNIPTSHYVLYSGDFNFYSSNEPAYQKIINSTNSIILKDPITALGTWNHASFSAIHTQCTRVSNTGFGTGVNAGGSGGMDDRFDFIMMSENFWNTGTLTYVPDSYKAYGNNGNCFNKDTNDASCTGIYSAELRDKLYWMSDHLPVIAELSTTQTFLTLPEITTTQWFLQNTKVDDKVMGYTPKPLALQLYNTMGQLVDSFSVAEGNFELLVPYLSQGMYYLTTENKTYKICKL